MLRVVVADMPSYDVFYKKLIGAVPLKNVTSRFAMEKIKSVTAALPGAGGGIKREPAPDDIRGGCNSALRRLCDRPVQAAAHVCPD